MAFAFSDILYPLRLPFPCGQDTTPLSGVGLIGLTQLTAVEMRSG